MSFISSRACDTRHYAAYRQPIRTRHPPADTITRRCTYTFGTPNGIVHFRAVLFRTSILTQLVLGSAFVALGTFRF
jgi:hypothetical protein